MQIKATTIPEAQLKACKAIIEEGIEITTEDNEFTLEYPEPILFIISDPLKEPTRSSFTMFGKEAMDKYTNDLLNGTEHSFVYTYHDRLFKHDSKRGYIDQIWWIIHKLKENPNSRRAQAITWYTNEDLWSKNPPCLQRMQFLVRNNKLNMHVDFRSNDMLSAFNANVYALAHLQKHVATELNIEPGTYSHLAVSAHIYVNRDKPEYNKMKLEAYK